MDNSNNINDYDDDNFDLALTDYEKTNFIDETDPLVLKVHQENMKIREQMVTIITKVVNLFQTITKNQSYELKRLNTKVNSLDQQLKALNRMQVKTSDHQRPKIINWLSLATLFTMIVAIVIMATALGVGDHAPRGLAHYPEAYNEIEQDVIIPLPKVKKEE